MSPLGGEWVLYPKKQMAIQITCVSEIVTEGRASKNTKNLLMSSCEGFQSEGVLSSCPNVLPTQNPSFPPNRAQPNNVQLYSETPLHTAASMGFDDCLRLLIEHNACLEVVMGTMKMTALHLGAQASSHFSPQRLLSISSVA